ncbi:hypothetical protein [Gibbsiella quercinecans]|nr:hypothetical protein [Gibbsiella quercinecans]
MKKLIEVIWWIALSVFASTSFAGFVISATIIITCFMVSMAVESYEI